MRSATTINPLTLKYKKCNTSIIRKCGIVSAEIVSYEAVNGRGLEGYGQVIETEYKTRIFCHVTHNRIDCGLQAKPAKICDAWTSAELSNEEINPVVFGIERISQLVSQLVWYTKS